MNVLDTTSEILYPSFKTINSDLFMIPDTLEKKDYMNGISRIMKMLPVSKEDVSDMDASNNHIKYTLEHKLAIMALAYEFMGYVSKRIILHDTEKLVLYTMMDPKIVHCLHRSHSIHHSENFMQGNHDATDNQMEAILDYECARYTKSNKPLNAYATIMKYYPSDFHIQENILMKFNICSPENKDCDFKNWDRVSGLYMPVFEELTINTLNDLNLYLSVKPIDEVLKGYNDYLLSLKL